MSFKPATSGRCVAADVLFSDSECTTKETTYAPNDFVWNIGECAADTKEETFYQCDITATSMKLNVWKGDNAKDCKQADAEVPFEATVVDGKFDGC